MMRVKFWGTRGSVPVAAPSKVAYGGNTTCLQIISECLPSGCDLLIDAGSGVVPYANDMLGRTAAAAQLEGRGAVKQVALFFTHYHFDHMQGLTLAPFAYMPQVQKDCYGPVELNVGPKEMLEHIFHKPFHPVSFAEIAHHWRFKALRNPSGQVLLVHPEAGIHLKALHELNGALQRDGQQLKLGELTCSLNECLVVRMHFSEHPERTVSYSIHERSTGRIFVLLTDHECLVATPTALSHHLQGANLLVMDAQYTEMTYRTRTAGFGHGTAPYCVKVAQEVEAERLGLTHHDPNSTDRQIEEILAEGCQAAVEVGYAGEVFAVRDYLELEV